MKHRVNRVITAAILTGGLLFAGTSVSAETVKDLNKEYGVKDEIIKGNPDTVFLNVSKNHIAQKEKHPSKGKTSALTTKEALGLFKESQNSYWYVVRGGDGKRNEATFTHNDMEYRYMAQSLNTMKKLKAYLGKTYTSEQVTTLIKKLGIIERKGVLAQPNADGGSILNWEKATIKENSSTATSKKFTLNVPLGDTKEVETLQGELRYEKSKGWRVHKLETTLNGDTPTAITSQQARSLFKEAQNSYWYVVRGGDGKRNEATFTHNNMEYRYMANSLNTMKKLKAYLGKTYTSEQVTALIKKLGIIERKGVLAQPNADGGSILNWEKATIKENSSTATSKKFTLNVPLGDTKEVETLQGELRYEKGKGWRVHSLEKILNGDTPPAITSQQARSLFVEAKNSYWYVVRGGDGKQNEATFTHNDMEYRYMAESLNTMKKLKAYLGKTYTSEQVTALIKKLGIIERKGVLAQPNADGGSRLMFEKATIKETASTETSKKFTLNVPLYGDGKEVETLQGELRYEKDKGWRVYSLETILNGDTPPAITLQQARSLFEEAKNSYWYVGRGGDGKRNEATFTYKGKDYRYMAESLNTMAKLKKYLGYFYTPDQQEKLIKELGIIEYKGVLAQPNADGGSSLNWGKAKIKEISSSNQAKHFEIDVPIGESSDYEALIGELRYVKEAEAWLVHRLEQRMSKSTK